MDLDRESFARAANLFADNQLREGWWEAWPRYEICPCEGGKSYIRRIEPNESDLGPPIDLAAALERTNGRVSPGSSEWDRYQEAMKRNEARKQSFPYQPLIREPGLFLKFASLAESGGLDEARTREELDTEKNRAVAYEWAHVHGVLGLRTTYKDGRLGAFTTGGKVETVAAFAYEAWVANTCLRLYEAAAADEVDVDLIRSYTWPSHRAFRTHTSTAAREFAMEVVAQETQHRIAGNAYPALYGEVGRFIQGWDFVNLLGAMWLQMFWLLTATEMPRKCRNWECGRVIAHEQPDESRRGLASGAVGGNKSLGRPPEFCSTRCKNRHHYLTRTKPRRQAHAN